MNRVWLSGLLLLILWRPASAQTGPAAEFDPHRIIVKLKPTSPMLTRGAAGMRMARVKQLRPLKENIASRTQPLPGGMERIFVTEIADGENLESVLKELAANPEVEYAERDYIMHADGAGTPTAGFAPRLPLVPDDPFFSWQWGLKNTGQTNNGTPGMDVNAAAAWDITIGDSNTILAILDTGILLNSPEFEGRIMPGWDFVNNDNYPTDDNDTSPFGHGSKMAGIAAATGNNGWLVAGMNWKCRILPVKVLNSSSSGLNSVIAAGIRWAADQGVNVISLSLGGEDGSQGLADAIFYARSHGAIIVASMGNNNNETAHFPAAYPGVIAVGAINSRGVRAAPYSCSNSGGSNYGNHISFVAPGDQIISLNYNDPNQLAQYPGCGTSDAVPFVSGLISLMYAINPVLTYDQVYEALKAGAWDQIGYSTEDTPGWDKYYGWGLIDAYRTLQAVPSATTSYFAQVAVGSGFTTTFTFVNTGADSGSGNLTLTADDGTPLRVLFSSPGQVDVVDSVYPVRVAAAGTQVITATAFNAPDVTTAGWGRIESSGGSLQGVATFQIASGGSLTTIAGVFSSSATNAATIPVRDDNTLGEPQNYSTGFAIANPGTEDLHFRMELRGEDGTSVWVLDPPELNPLKPGAHVARFLWQVLNNTALKFNGSITLTELDGKAFAVVALVMNQKLFTAIPVVTASAGGTTGHMFAQVALGSGFTTLFTLMNTGNATVSGNLILTGNEGLPLNAVFTAPGRATVTGFSYPVDIPASGTWNITAGAVASAAGATTAGWARLDSSGGTIRGVATFQLSAAGSLKTIAGVLSASSTAVATIPVNDNNTLGVKSHTTGYAVANPGNEDINIAITLLNSDGTLFRTISPADLNPLHPGQHVPRFIWEDLSDNQFRFDGSMVLTEQSGKPFSVVALVMNQQLFTAIPVIPAKSPGKVVSKR